MSVRNSYIVGFILSVALTLFAYYVVVVGWLGEKTLGVIMLLALAQFAVQAVFFLHTGKTSRPSWSDVALYFMLMVVVIIVMGSMWIMSNLDYHHGVDSPQSIEQIIIEKEGFNKESKPTHDEH